MGEKRKNKIVFLNYANADEPMAQWLVKHLDKHATVWTDRHVAFGAQWVGEVDQAIRNSQLVLSLITPDYLKSPFTHLEAGMALKHARVQPDLRVVPVLMKGVTSEEVPPLLRSRKSLDASRMSREELLQEIRQLISQRVGDDPAASQAVEPEGTRPGK